MAGSLSARVHSSRMGDVGIDTLDMWVGKLMECTPLTEHEVKLLCDKVSKPRL